MASRFGTPDRPKGWKPHQYRDNGLKITEERYEFFDVQVRVALKMGMNVRWSNGGMFTKAHLDDVLAKLKIKINELHRNK